MKKIVSLILSVAIIMTMLIIPTAAAETQWVVDITSIADGDTFNVGEDVLLTADATTLAASVKNIDFYANGDKIPGTVADNAGSVTWLPSSEGVYDITTKVTFSGDGTVVSGNETVRIVVLPPKAETTVIWGGESNLQVGNSSSTTLSDKYAIFGTHSAMFAVTTTGDWKFKLSKEVVCDWNRGGVVLYCENDVPLDATYSVLYGFKKSDGTTGTKRLSGSQLSLRKGYNYFSVQSIGSGSTLTSVEITVGGLTIGSPVYICGIIGMKSDSRKDTAPQPTAAIGTGDNATGICNELGTYRINFDAPIFPDATKVPATVTVGGAEVSGVTYKYGFDYVEMNLPTLQQGATYTVSIPAETIRAFDGFKADQYTSKFVAATDFTFTTKDTACDSATPVVMLSYPATEGCLSNTGFASQVIAPSSAINTVKFYNGDTELAGTATKMTDGEWWFEPENELAEGTYTISAKFLDASSNVIATTAAKTYNVTSAPKYYLKGIGEGDVIVAAEEPSRTITIVDEANANVLPTDATNVEKVEFYNDGTLLDTVEEAPYKYNLVFDNYGEHTLTAKVYDAFGNITPYNATYKVVNGIKNTTYSYEETFSTLTDASQFYANISGSGLSADISENKITFANTVTSYKQFAFKYAPINQGNKVYYYEFNLTKPDATQAYTIELGSKWASHEVNLIEASDNLTGKIGLVIDFNSNYATVRVGGKDMKKVSLLSFETNNDVVVHVKVLKQQSITIDDFKFAVYDVNATAAFGTDIYEREFTGDALAGKSSIDITTKAINTTQTDESLVNIIAVYGAGDVLLSAPLVEKLDYKKGDFKSRTYNVPLVEGVQKVRVFTWDGLNTLVPLDAWK